MNEAKATRHQRRRRRADVWGWCVMAAGAAVLGFSPVSVWLRDEVVRGVAVVPAPLRASAALVLFSLVLAVVWEAARLSVTAVSADRATSSRGALPGRTRVTGAVANLTLSCALVVAAALSLQLSARMLGGAWWLGTSVGFALVLCAAMGLGPAIFARLATIGPITRPDLASAVAAVAEIARVPVAGVLEWHVGHESRASALITGVGRGRRVLVSSTLARHWSADEVAVVVAHELGHIARHDLARAVALNVGIVAVGLWGSGIVLPVVGPLIGVTGPADLAALPLVGVVTGLVWALSAPLRHAQSRRQERRADVFALSCTGEAGAFAAALRRLGAERLAEDRPALVTEWLFHGHPSVSERIATAERYVREHHLGPLEPMV
jgi:STE24 endopeptidase